MDAFRYLFLCNRYRTVNLIGIFRCTLGFQLGDIIIPLFLYGGSLRLEITIFAQEFLQGFLLFLFLLGGIPVFPAINICNGGIIYLRRLYALRGRLSGYIGKLFRSNLFPGGFQLIVQFNALLFLTRDTVFFSLEIKQGLRTLPLVSLFRQGDTLILYLLTGF